MKRELISVVVPVFFNAESLPRLAQRLQAIAATADFDIEAIFVDDGSGDDSWNRIEAIARSWPAARGLRLTRNFGSQMAIAAGLRDAGGDAAAVLSADLQEPPELLPELVAAWRRGATTVLAARRSRPEGWTTRAAAGMYYRALRRLALSQMPTSGFDCFLIGRDAIDFLADSREIHTSLPGLLLWAGFPAAMVPYDRVARAVGESRWTLAKKLLNGQPIQGWTSLMVAVAFFSGVQLVCFGILGEYLWRTLDAARSRQGFLVRTRTSPPLTGKDGRD